MKTYTAAPDKVAYDAHADTLFVGLQEAPCTEVIDTPKGITVYYSYPQGEVVGVSVERYRRRFGMESQSIQVDAENPFRLDFKVAL